MPWKWIIILTLAIGFGAIVCDPVKNSGHNADFFNLGNKK
jgi:hypothetical protein